MTAMIELRPARASDYETATRWLAAAGLPTADLSAVRMDAFLLATDQDRPIGMIGLEPYAQFGLLRSLIVDPEYRGKGLGAKLIAALEAKATAAGVAELWLLTLDADAFFTRHGYAVRQRDAAPTAIRNSAEFASLCPGDAVLMQKRLGPD